MLISDLLEKMVSQGVKCKIDFKKRNLTIGRKRVITEGVVENEYELDEVNADVFGEIEKCYEKYYYSRPSERSEGQQKTYFKAMSYDDMTDEQLICGSSRELAKAELEYTMLNHIIRGWKWCKDYGSWYWKSKKFNTLIILREWIGD